MFAMLKRRDARDKARTVLMRRREKREEMQFALLQRLDRRDKQRLQLQQRKLVLLFERHKREKDRHAVWMKLHAKWNGIVEKNIQIQK